MLPCGVPLSRLYSEDRVSPSLTFIFLSFRKFFINMGRCPSNPIFFSIYSKPCTHTISKAFSMSKYTATKYSDLRRFSRIADSNLTSESYVEWDFLDPL